MRNELLDIDLIKLLPESLRRDPDTAALMQAISEEMQRMFQECEELLSNDLPDILLDYMAYEKNVDFYDPGLSNEEKRKLIQQSKSWKRQKGTPAALEQIVSAVFRNAKVDEWFNYEGDPFHFRIETEQPLRNENDLSRLLTMIDVTKRRTAKLDDITIKRNMEIGKTYGGIFSNFNKSEVYPVPFVIPLQNHERYFSGLISSWNTVTIYPEEI